MASTLSQSGMTQRDLSFCSFVSLCSGRLCGLFREGLQGYNFQRNPLRCRFLEDWRLVSARGCLSPFSASKFGTGCTKRGKRFIGLSKRPPLRKISPMCPFRPPAETKDAWLLGPRGTGAAGRRYSSSGLLVRLARGFSLDFTARRIACLRLVLKLKGRGGGAQLKP